MPRTGISTGAVKNRLACAFLFLTRYYASSFFPCPEEGSDNSRVPLTSPANDCLIKPNALKAPVSRWYSADPTKACIVSFVGQVLKN